MTHDPYAWLDPFEMAERLEDIDGRATSVLAGTTEQMAFWEWKRRQLIRMSGDLSTRAVLDTGEAHCALRRLRATILFVLTGKPHG